MIIKTDYDELTDFLNFEYNIPDNEGAKLLYAILMSDNVSELLDLNKAEIMKYVPEISEMIGYNQNNPCHHLDLWNHTLAALNNSLKNIEIRMCLFLHDISKPKCCVITNGISHYLEHNEVSSVMAKEILERMGWSENFIENVCNLIRIHDSSMTEEFIRENIEFAKKLLQVQICDILAHNVKNFTNRLKYLKDTILLIKQVENENK